MGSRRSKLYKAVTAVMAVTVLLCAGYIIVHRLGLAPGYDFGAGAYYYADIPGFERILREDVYHTDVPTWVHIALFLAWGWLMYRLWVWIDRRGR